MGETEGLGWGKNGARQGDGFNGASVVSRTA